MAINHVIQSLYRDSTPTPGLGSPVAPQLGVGINGSSVDQEEFTEKGFQDPTPLPPQSTSVSSIGQPLPSCPLEVHSLRGVSSLMPSDGRLPEKPNFTALPSPPTGMNRTTTSQPHSQAVSPTRRSQQPPPIQTNPLFFTPSAVLPNQNFPYPQNSPVATVHHSFSASSSQGTATSPLFLGSPSSPQSYMPPSPYVHRNGFTGQFMLSPQHPPPFSNAPPQPYPYPPAHRYNTQSGMPVEPGHTQQSPQGYVPMIQSHPQPYFQAQPRSPNANHPPFQSTLRASSSAPQPAPGGAASPLPGSHNGHPYQLLHYSSPSSPFSFPQFYQPSPFQWFYAPGPPTSPFNDAVPYNLHRYPISYPQAPPHPRPPDTWTQGPSSVERHGPVSAAQLSSSFSEARPGRKSILPPSTQPQVPAPAPSSPHDDQRVVEPSSPAHPQHERPIVRRHYHPNPPPHRSDWVMWVGNVPGDTSHDEFWRFLTQPESPGPGRDGEDADSGVTSIFLISRSNCAFANFETEEQLSRAIARFNGRQLRPHDRRCPKLVCRARRKEDDLRAGVGAQRGVGVHTQYIKKLQQQAGEKADEEPSSVDDRHSYTGKVSRPPPTPLVPSMSSEEEATCSSAEAGSDSKMVKTHSVSSYASTTSSFLVRHFPKRYFILKSLTQFDLDMSVERGLWATQKHNETILDQAYRTSKEVILIFGVNKSGEFYGYARMAGRILHGEHRVSWASRVDSSPSALSPLSHRPSRGSPVEPKSPLISTSSRGSPLTYFTPSESRLVEESPKQFIPPLDVMASPSPSQFQPVERQSAPAVFGPQLPEEFSPDPAPKFSLSGSRLRSAAAPLIPKGLVHIAQKDIVLDREAPVRAMRNNSASSEEAKPGVSTLQPVEEEKVIGSGDDEGAQKAVEEQKPPEGEGRDAGWGESFKIEWLCTQRLSFHRIRHLRNPWNHDREIKVSRDGTELEPGVGQQLIDEWSKLAENAEEEEGASRATKPSNSALPTSEEGRDEADIHFDRHVLAL